MAQMILVYSDRPRRGVRRAEAVAKKKPAVSQAGKRKYLQPNKHTAVVTLAATESINPSPFDANLAPKRKALPSQSKAPLKTRTSPLDTACSNGTVAPLQLQHRARSQQSLVSYAPSCNSLTTTLQSQSTYTLSRTPLSTLSNASSATLVKRRPESQRAENVDAGVKDAVAAKLDSIITSIDGEAFSGRLEELDVSPSIDPTFRPRGGGLGLHKNITGVAQAADKALVQEPRKKTNFFTKVNLYANSRLPPNLPRFKLHLPAYPLICLAAQYSLSVYMQPVGAERETHVDSDWRHGTKAMVIKSVPVDNMDVIVFAIRGSQTFYDWAVNLDAAPASPQGFLDDAGNLCHSGFLSVARRMVRPVAARLRALLDEDPARSACSLVLTGHSAGGAVAALLYAHMLASSTTSELKVLAQYFKRIHCFTFGAPPVSLLPLQKPEGRQLSASLFLALINEGDPVPRASKPYIRSLLDLYASPPPGSSCLTTLLYPPLPSTQTQHHQQQPQQPNTPKRKFNPFRALRRDTGKDPTTPTQPGSAGFVPVHVWTPPAGTLSIAGRIVVLRDAPRSSSSPASASGLRGGGALGFKIGKTGKSGANGSGGGGVNGGGSFGVGMGVGVGGEIRACAASDQLLRGVMFGDPTMHVMALYKARVEFLATRAVMGRGGG